MEPYALLNHENAYHKMKNINNGWFRFSNIFTSLTSPGERWRIIKYIIWEYSDTLLRLGNPYLCYGPKPFDPYLNVDTVDIKFEDHIIKLCQLLEIFVWVDCRGPHPVKFPSDRMPIIIHNKLKYGSIYSDPPIIKTIDWRRMYNGNN